MRALSTRLRFILAAIAIVAVLPAAGAVLYIQSAERHAAVQRTTEENVRLVRLAASRQASVFDGARRLLLTLARFPALSADDASGCRDTLAPILREHPDYNNLSVVRADASLLCSARPVDSAQLLEGRRRTWFDRAVGRRDTVIGEFQISATTGVPSIVVAHPILDRAGSVTRVIAASIRLDSLSALAGDAELAEGGAVTLFDRSGHILARFPDGSRWVGQSISNPGVIAPILAGAADARGQTTGVDGVTRLFVVVPVRTSIDAGLFMGLGAPTSTVFAAANRTFVRYLWLLALATAAAVVAAFVAGQLFVVGPVSVLSDATLRTERELRETEGSYKKLFHQNPHPMWVFDRLTLAFLEVNEAAVRTYGYSRHEFLSMRVTDIRPSEDVPRLEASLAQNREPWARSGGWRHRLKSGEIIDVEIASHLFTFEGRDAELVTVHDVTDRTRAESALAERTRITALTADVGVALNLPRDVGRCLQRCAEALVAHLDAQSARIWIWRPAKGTLSLEAEAGAPGAVGEPLAWRAATEHHACFDEGAAAYPLALGSTIVGVMTVAGPNLSETVTTGLASVADVIALGIERHVADEARRESEARLTLFASAVSEAFWIAKADHSQIVYVSPAFESIFGRSRAALYRDAGTFIDMIHPDDRARVQENIRSQSHGRPFSHEYRIVKPSGEIRWISDRAYPVQPHDGGPVTQYVGVAQDITERHHAETALRDAEERMRFALEAANVGVWEAHMPTGRLYWSETCERMHGFAPGSFPGTIDALLACLAPSDRNAVAATLERAQREDKKAAVEYSVLWPDGSAHAIVISGHFSTDAAGALLRGAGVAMDVTERRSLEDQLRQAQKMEAVGQLAGGIAHDFNNLLTAILGFAGMLADSFDAGDGRHGDVAEIQRAAERAAALTRQLLAFSRKQILCVRVLHVGDVVSGLTPMLRRLLGETIDLRTAVADRGLVKADPGQLEQVILNLAVNARDAMIGNGQLTIETSDVMLDEAFARSHPSVAPGPHVRLAVADNGCGMDAETQKRIFEPFFTTKPKDRGTGLGLATVYGIVKQSGGSIWVKSQPDRGTTFTVYLPYTEETVQPAAATVAKAPGRGVETVLVVEDDTLVREYVYKVLSRRGYSVYPVDDPARAIEYAEAHHAPIDLVFSDVVLPGMSGPAMVEQLHRSHPESRSLFMSGYADQAIVGDGLEDGMAFLQKPFTADAVAQKVRQVLDQQRPGA